MIVLAAVIASIGTASDMPRGFFRGTLVAWSGTAVTGILTARNAAGAIQGCGYDSLSYFEEFRERITAPKLQTGDPLEIITDRKPGSIDCYIRILHVLQPEPPPSRRPAAVASRALPELPRGDRTVSGVVIRVDGGKLTLRDHDGETTYLLRKDTEYVSNGVRMGAADLLVNTRVSVRAGRDIYGNVQAYQVMWGEILDVR